MIASIIGAIIIILVVAIILYHVKANYKDKLLWNNMGSMTQYYDLVSKYGEPNKLDDTAGGSAIWESSGDTLIDGLFNNITIKDKRIPHMYPNKHVDFLWATLPITLNMTDKVQGVLDELKTNYEIDYTNGRLTVRCCCMPNIITVMLLLAEASADALPAENIETLIFEYTMGSFNRGIRAYLEGELKRYVKA
jgi:hypothetical protein